MKIARNVQIPLRDGTHLCATLYLGDEVGPVPAVIDLPPYRKDDFAAVGDDYAMRYFAQRGYASVFVDMRACGSSGGDRIETFDSIREGQDGADVVAWVAAQPWCSGEVGMIGISYPGLNSLQTAAQRPPALKAIVPIMPADGAYDTLYPGGSQQCYQPASWSSMMFAFEMLPPTVREDGPGWREAWIDKLGDLSPRELPWRAHARSTGNEYWQRRDVDFASIEAATLMVGSWNDIFIVSTVRGYEQITAPKRLVVGPWEHLPPDISAIAPIDHLGLALAWFDRWLKGAAAPAVDDAPVTLYVQGTGDWRGEQEWPVARAELRRLHLSAGRIMTKDSTQVVQGQVDHQCDPTVGVQSILADGLSGGNAFALDQGPDELKSIVFDAVSEDWIEITGTAEVSLEFDVLEAGPAINVVAKISDVAPDGSSRLISFGSTEVVAAGQWSRTRVGFPLNPVSYVVAPGHVLRLAVSFGDFPRLWPTEVSPRIRMLLGGDAAGRLDLPVVPAPSDHVVVMPMPDPDLDTMPLVSEFKPVRWASRDEMERCVTLATGQVFSSALAHGDGSLEVDLLNTFTVSEHAPTAAEVVSEVTAFLRREREEACVVTTVVRQGRDSLTASAEVHVGDELVFAKTWKA